MASRDPAHGKTGGTRLLAIVLMVAVVIAVLFAMVWRPG